MVEFDMKTIDRIVLNLLLILLYIHFQTKNRSRF